MDVVELPHVSPSLQQQLVTQLTLAQAANTWWRGKCVWNARKEEMGEGSEPAVKEQGTSMKAGSRQ